MFFCFFFYRLNFFFNFHWSWTGQRNNSAKHQRETSLISSCVSLIASLVSLLVEAYQRAPFINARIKPLLWLPGWHSPGVLRRGGRRQNKGSRVTGSPNWRYFSSEEPYETFRREGAKRWREKKAVRVSLGGRSYIIDELGSQDVIFS